MKNMECIRQGINIEHAHDQQPSSSQPKRSHKDTANRDNSPRPYSGVGSYWGEPYSQGGPESSRAGLWRPFRTPQKPTRRRLVHKNSWRLGGHFQRFEAKLQKVSKRRPETALHALQVLR